MIHSKLILSVLFVFTQMLISNASNYYFSSIKGNDNNSGISPDQAWKSVSKLQEVIDNAQQGDVILIERGSAWNNAQINISCKTGLSLTAYGEGKAPVISGYKELTDPLYIGNNLYVFYEPQVKNDYRKTIRFQDGGNPWFACNLNFLLIDDKPYDMGRHPNGKVYYDIETISPDKKSFFTESDNVWSDGYWDGAQVKVFPQHWIPEDLRVTDYKNNTFNLNVGDWNSMYDLSNQNIWYGTGIKYYIFNHKNTLDQDGEWCLDRDNQTITVYSTTSLLGKKVKQTFLDTVIFINGCSDLKVKNIEFRGGKKYTMNLINSTNVDIDSCIFRYTPIYAAFVDNNISVSFQYDTFIDATNMGIFFHSNYGETAKYCYGRNIGISEGIGGDENNDCFRFVSSHQRDGGVTFEHNRIDSFGYAAIGIFLPNSTSADPVSIKYNYIKNGPMLLTDAAGFYCSGDWVSTKKEVKYNVIEDIYSNTGNSWNSTALSMGLYLDVDAEFFEVDSNTVNGTQYGIYLNGTSHNYIRHNHIANVSKAGMVGKGAGFGHNGKGTLSCNFLNNVSVTKNAQATGFEWFYGSYFIDGGTLVDYNNYYNPFSINDACIGRYSDWTKFSTSLAQWRGISNWEIHSTYNKNGYKNNPMEVHPDKCVKVLWNLSGSLREVDLKDCIFVDQEGNEVKESIDVEPYYSQILFLTAGDSVDYISNGVIEYSLEGITAVEEVRDVSNISCFPVPANDHVNFNNVPINSRISVYNLMGNKMFEFKNNESNQVVVDLNGLRTGIYLFEIISPDKNVGKCFKIIKN